jgi:hypothetical protein
MLSEAEKSAIKRQIENLEHQLDFLKSHDKSAEAEEVSGQIEKLYGELGN